MWWVAVALVLAAGLLALMLLPGTIRRRKILDHGTPAAAPDPARLARLSDSGQVTFVGWAHQTGVFQAVAGVEGRADLVVLRMFPAHEGRTHDMTDLDRYLLAAHRFVTDGAPDSAVELRRPPPPEEQLPGWLDGSATRWWKG